MGFPHGLRKTNPTKFGRELFGEFVWKLKLTGIIKNLRDCYPMQLDANDFGIAYIMAIDGLFLFVLLLHFGIRNESSDGKLQKIDTSNVLGGLRTKF